VSMSISGSEWGFNSFISKVKYSICCKKIRNLPTPKDMHYIWFL